jgi:hypothetical protein
MLDIELLDGHLNLSNAELHAAIGLMAKLLLKILIGSFFLLPFSLLKAQVVDPNIQWNVMKLPHFDLIYDARHQDLANLYADRLEDNRKILANHFTQLPDRVSVVLNDRTDLTNGYATPIPYRTIMLFPVLPNPLETISEYGDWARELTMHEYTHILSFEARRGLVTPLYYAFGSIITPNMLLPRWFLEGIAVDLETRTSNKGRLRSAFQDASVRAYVLENKLKDVTLAEIAETAIHTWPQGGRPYLFGSLMWSEMIHSHGTQLINQLHWRYGGRFPFFIEGPVWDYTQRSYEGHFQQMKLSLVEKVEAQLQKLKSVPLSAGPELVIKGGVENFSPRISPDGLKMILISKDDTNKRSVQILKRKSTDIPFDGRQVWDEIDQDINESLPGVSPAPRRGLELDGPPGGTIVRIEWSADSQKFIFDKLDEIDRFKDSADLYLYDLKNKKSTQITNGARAREASLSPDAKWAAFVQLQAGNTALALLDIETKKIQVLYQPELQTRISSPSFLSQDDLIFSMRKNGKENLYRLRIKAAHPELVLEDYPEAHFPEVTAQGLTFISSKNGTENLYLASSDLKSAKALTQTGTFVSGGTFDPSRKEIYVSELTTRGFQIRRFPAKTMGALPEIKPLLADRYPQQPAQEISSVEKPAPEEYSAWKYMLPHYWLPNIYVYEGGSLVGASTSSADPLSKHSYSLSAAYDSKPNEPALNFLYVNNQTRAIVAAQAFDFYQNVVNTASRFHFQDGKITSAWQMLGWNKDLYVGGGWAYSGRTFSNFAGYQNGPTLFATYSDTSQSGAQISPESGQSLRLEVTSYLKGDRQTEEFQRYNLFAEKYFAKWLPKHHAVQFRIQSQYISQSVNAGNYAFTLPFNPFGSLPSGLFVLRGYRSGSLLGKTLTNAGVEYRLPLSYVYRGAGTTPFFLRRLHAALLAEAAVVDGFAFNPQTSAYEAVPNNKIFNSSGIELKADVTLGFSFPLTVVAGFYWAHDPRFREVNQQFVIGIQ